MVLVFYICFAFKKKKCLKYGGGLNSSANEAKTTNSNQPDTSLNYKLDYSV